MNTEARYAKANDEFDLDARPQQQSSSAVASGWDGAESVAPQTGDFPTEFKHSEEIQVIKFLDQDGPFASYKLHFLQQKTSGKRSYVCLGDKCPLCTVLGHQPEVKRAFTIANVSSNPVQKQMLIATPRLYKTLHAAHFSPMGPLTKNYWGISRTGVKQTTVYNFNSIKGRDLDEEWGINQADVEAAIADMTPFERSDIREHTYQELLEIAESLS